MRFDIYLPPEHGCVEFPAKQRLDQMKDETIGVRILTPVFIRLQCTVEIILPPPIPHDFPQKPVRRCRAKMEGHDALTPKRKIQEHIYILEQGFFKWTTQDQRLRTFHWPPAPRQSSRQSVFFVSPHLGVCRLFCGAPRKSSPEDPQPAAALIGHMFCPFLHDSRDRAREPASSRRDCCCGRGAFEFGGDG